MVQSYHLTYLVKVVVKIARFIKKPTIIVIDRIYLSLVGHTLIIKVGVVVAHKLAITTIVDIVITVIVAVDILKQVIVK